MCVCVFSKEKRRNEESRSFVDCRMPRATLEQGMHKYVRLRNSLCIFILMERSRKRKEKAYI